MNIQEGLITETLYNEAHHPYEESDRHIIRETVRQLLETDTSNSRPGMLLGKIQSGKTKTFLGVIALAADSGIQQFVILTKGTKALTSQTFERLRSAFETSIDYDELRVFDIMALPKLTQREQKLPMIIVVKKERRNLDRLSVLMQDTYPAFKNRKTLIIDDEADFASIGFKKKSKDLVEMQSIMSAIDSLRMTLSDSSFLQVTATPYSLYLQPEQGILPDSGLFRPVKPAFTELVPIHDAYIGGETYFEKSKDVGSVESFLYVPVDESEIKTLHHADRRKYKPEEALQSNAIPKLRLAILNFVVGGLTMRYFQKLRRDKPKKYSFIIHTETSRKSHEWQEEVIDTMIVTLRDAAKRRDESFVDLVHQSYDDIKKSIDAYGSEMPSFKVILEEVIENLDTIQVEKVNSERDVLQLLDRDGQLDLRNPLNIFIGGQILDRGLTIGNLIGFYYGRRTQRYQQDTVLQHHRMYGARSREDLTVTRFYTTRSIYDVLETVHEFDTALRDAISQGDGENGVIFMRKDEKNRVVPCAPNKVLVSSLITLKPKKRIVPSGFQTGYKSNILTFVNKVDEIVERFLTEDATKPILINLDIACNIIDLVSKTFVIPDDTKFLWDHESFKSAMNHASISTAKGPEIGQVLLLARRERNLSRVRSSGRYEDAPDTGEVAQFIPATNTAPVLMMFRQEGAKSQGWRDCPFWWPLLRMSDFMPTTIFAAHTDDEDLSELED